MARERFFEMRSRAGARLGTCVALSAPVSAQGSDGLVVSRWGDCALRGWAATDRRADEGPHRKAGTPANGKWAQGSLYSAAIPKACLITTATPPPSLAVSDSTSVAFAFTSSGA